MHSIINICSAALVFLLGLLSLNTSRMRRKTRAQPALSDVELTKAIRAQGNAAEYIPIIVALLLYSDLRHFGEGGFLLLVALFATISRFAHAAGMLWASSATTTHPLKALGAIGTYIALFLLAGSLVASAF